MQVVNENYLGCKYLILSEDKYGLGTVEYFGVFMSRKYLIAELEKDIYQKQKFFTQQDVDYWNPQDHEGLSIGEWYFKNHPIEANRFIENLVLLEAKRQCKYNFIFEDYLNKKTSYIHIYKNKQFVATIAYQNRGGCDSYIGQKLLAAEISNNIKTGAPAFSGNTEKIQKELKENKMFEQAFQSRLAIERNISFKNSVRNDNEKVPVHNEVIWKSEGLICETAKESGQILARISNNTNKKISFTYEDFNCPEEPVLVLLSPNEWFDIFDNYEGEHIMNQILEDKINVLKQVEEEPKPMEQEIKPSLKETILMKEHLQDMSVGDVLNRWKMEKPSPKGPLIDRYKSIKRDAVIETKKLSGAVAAGKPVRRAI